MHFLPIFTALAAANLARAVPAPEAADQSVAAFVTMTAYEDNNWSGASIGLQVNVQSQCCLSFQIIPHRFY
jgi:hypothetical protein